MIPPTTRQLGQALGFAALLLAAGCEKESPTMPPNTATPKPTAQPATSKAQPRLETIKLYLGAAELTAEVANENRERQAGMMHRASMSENEGMLFVFPFPHRAGFWMKNTTVPLSIAYIDPASRVIEIHDLQPGNTHPVESRSARVQYALEVNQGWFERNGIKPGSLIATDRGSLAVSVRGH
ncbi:MAG: DUF192 domain-containing protein [Verrucomicrobiota bacterium]|jgi:hypothetical protein|nr:DUF192 domain-containing protein [Verrucomicrobiota bacterium]